MVTILEKAEDKMTQRCKHFSLSTRIKVRAAEYNKDKLMNSQWLFFYCACGFMQLLENLEQRIEELQKEIEETHELRYNFEMFLKV